MQNKVFSINTHSAKETQKLGEILAKTILECRHAKRAQVLSLEGDLGSGKTTFTQGFAKGLGVKQTPKSPTFIIMQIFDLDLARSDLARFIHIDAYRITAKDLAILGWNEFIKDGKNIILVEWGGRIKKLLPLSAITIKFKHDKNQQDRKISIGGNVV